MLSTATAGRTSFLPFCRNQATVWDTMSTGIPLFQAFSPIPVQRSTYCDCIKDGRKIDPCCGSGHILVYMFDVLMQIYETSGYTKREAVLSIIENNLYGLDIDERAAQLAYFAVMMKGCQYDRRFLTRGVQPRVYAIEESNNINRAQLDCLGADLSDIEKNAAKMQLNGLLDALKDAKEYGSILTVDNYDWELLRRYTASPDADGQISMEYIGIEQTTEQLQNLIDIGEAMAQKYDAVVTNPPYMGASGMGARLSKYVKEKYPDSKSDLFAVFLERCEKFIANNRYQAMITQHAWMFLSSFEKLRTKLLSSNDISTMVHLGARAFEEIGGEVVQTTSFILKKGTVKNYKGKYCRLIDPVTQYGKEKLFLEKENRYSSEQANFSKIPGSPVAYWLSDEVFELYADSETMEAYAHPKVGMQTSNNEKYLRLWFEITYNEFNGSSLGLKWIKYLKGGAYRKWYGNLEYLLFYNNNPNYILQQKNARVLDLEFLKKKKCTWTDLTSGNNSFRLAPDDTFYDISGHCFFPSEDNQFWLLAYANSVIFSMLKKVFNSTFHCQVGDVAKIVVPILNMSQKEIIAGLSKINVEMSRNDWDYYETSWDFTKHPLI